MTESSKISKSNQIPTRSVQKSPKRTKNHKSGASDLSKSTVPTAEELQKIIKNASRVGLSPQEVLHSRQKYGANTMTKKRKKSFFRLFFENLGDPVIRVLIISLVVNVIFTFGQLDYFETGGILVAILLATTVSTLSEYSSSEAFRRLNDSARQKIRVIRGGKIEEIDASSIVISDVIPLSAGDKIPADGVLISGEILLDQSVITGESKEVKKTKILLSSYKGDSPSFPTNSNIQAKSSHISPTASRNSQIKERLFNTSNESDLLSPSSVSSCLGGCLVSSGEGEMVVLRVGDSSFLGSILTELQRETRESPLKVRLTKLAKQISALGYGAALFIAILSLFSSIVIGSDFSSSLILSKITNPSIIIPELLHSITLGLTVVIMAVPEGLPMMIAVVLSSNVKRMLSANVLVRKQTGIESAGSMNLLFTDKTGTLTTGRMTLDGFVLGSGEFIGSRAALKRSHPDIYAEFCKNSLSNTSCRILGRTVTGGNSTERALCEASLSFPLPDYSKITQKLPFDSKNKYSSATYGNISYFKGAPEVLIPHLEKSESVDLYALNSKISALQSSGKRVLLLCSGKSSALRELSLICAVSLSDPLRKEVKNSVATLKDAGISVVMITGDAEQTARSIAEEAGLINSKRYLSLSHGELEKMSDDELSAALPSLSLVCRALPSDKSRLVRIAQEMGLVVGMTGDGINDAPALKLSDVGFSMGSGNEVAREASDVVILDNNLKSIVNAVLYGRNIFKSIRKFLVFQLTMNFSSALVCMLAPFFGYDTPITVSQMLWVNMIMDTLGGLAFAGEAPERRIMREKPKRRDEPILNRYMAHQIFISGSFSVLISMLFLTHPAIASLFRYSEGDRVHLSAFFGLFIFLSVMQCINSRTDRLFLLSGITKNKAFLLIMLIISALQISFIYLGGDLLRAAPLNGSELLITLFFASLAIPFELIRKIIWRFSGKSEGF